MNKVDVLSLESRFTMTELRREREMLMTKRLELIDKHKKMKKRILIQPFLASARPPSPPSSVKIKSHDTLWIKNMVTSVVYDAVREVEVSKPYREKTQFYEVIAMSYNELIDEFVSKSIKQTVVKEIADVIWTEVIKKEVNKMVKQCIGDADIVETFASTLILMSITKANKLLNPDVGDVLNEYDVAKNLMMELSLERNKRRTDRMMHKLHLDLKVKPHDAEGTSDQLDREESEVVFVGEHLTALQLFDIQRTQKMYLPIGFEKYCSSEIKLWKNIKISVMDVSQNNVIFAITISPSMRYAAVSIKNYLFVIKCAYNSVLAKTYIENTLGDLRHLCWSDTEEQILSTSSTGMVCSWVARKEADTNYHPKHSKAKIVFQPNMLEIQWSFRGSDLRITHGIFTQLDSDKTIRHVPVQSYFAPLYLPWGVQPVLFVACENKEILRLSWPDDDQLLLPEDIPRCEEIKNVTDNGVKVDILKGHKFPISKVIFKDEYVLYSIDENCGIIEWEYAKDNYDAYGYVIPKKFLVIGNDKEYVRLVKGVVNLFNKRGLKTRQEELRAAKTAESQFDEMGFGKKPHSSRLNEDGQLIEESFVESTPANELHETSGVVVVRKTLGKALYAMKSRIYKLKNTKPTTFLGNYISPCNSLIGYCFYFQHALYGEPYISVILLRTSDLTFIKNKIKIPLSAELANVINEDDKSFSFCITPAHYLTKAVYIVLKIGSSMMVVSSATSHVLRTTLDIHEYSCDNMNHLQEKHVGSIHGALRAVLWGSTLLVFGSLSKHCLSVSLVEPVFKDTEDKKAPSGARPSVVRQSIAGAPSTTDVYYEHLSHLPALVNLLDPDRKRLLLQAEVYWGKTFVNQCEKRDNVRYFRNIVNSLVSSVIQVPESKDTLVIEE